MAGKAYKGTISFIFFLILGAFIAYRGWLRVPLGNYDLYLAYTQTTGYKEEALQANRFYWYWEKVIPGNFELMKFELLPQELYYQYQSTLPGADTYRVLVPGNPRFEYNIRLSIGYRIKAESLANLVKSEQLQEADLANFYKTTSSNIQVSLANLFSNIISGAARDRVELTQLKRQVSQALSQEFLYLEIHNIQFLNFTIPDIELYEEAKSALNILNTDVAANLENISELYREQIKSLQGQQTIEQLSSIGAILEEYPILLKYLAIIYESPIDNFDVLPQKVTATAEN